jgi:hypothetical protein
MAADSTNPVANSGDNSDFQPISINKWKSISGEEISLNNDSSFIANVPDVFYNFPNPFSDKTQILFSLPETCSVVLKIFNINGTCLRKWEYSNQTAGLYSVDFNNQEFQGGSFYCQLLVKREQAFISKAIKMVLVE